MVIRNLQTQDASATTDVCAMGNAIVDVIVECDEVFLEAQGIAKGAMTLIDEQQAAALYKKMGPAIEMSGGSAANTAVGIASLGGAPSYIGKVKNDQFGTIFCHDMQASGVVFSTPPLQEGPSTAQCLILVTPDAQRSMNTYLGACVDFFPEDVDVELVAKAQVTYLEGYLFDKPKAQEAFYLAAKTVHEANRSLALSLSDTFCVDRHRDGFLKLVHDEVDFLIGNEMELISLYQTSSFEEAMEKARQQCSIVVGTRSEKGAVIVSGEETHIIQAEKAESVLDTTGAGDLFAAGFLYGVTHGHDWAMSGRLGAIAAAEIISHYGPRPQRNLKAYVQEKEIKI